jgi:hypothetical protein
MRPDSVRQNAEDTQSPSRRDSKNKHEPTRDKVIRVGSFAPALEHANYSSRKQQDCDDSERFNEHIRALQTIDSHRQVGSNPEQSL